MPCGCGEPHESHGDERNIVYADLKKAADASKISVKEAVQVWLSAALAPALKSAWIGRRRNLTGDGTDHDPAWVELSI
jgi:hypothetical protein